MFIRKPFFRELKVTMVIYKYLFNVRVNHDVVIPPFSSKVSRTLLTLVSPLYKEMIEDKSPLKPFRVTVLKDSGVSVMGGTLKMDKIYSFSFTTLKEDFSILQNPSLKTELWGTEFQMELSRVEAVSSFEPSDKKFFHVKFKTPTLLQPPRPMKAKSNRFVLFPYSPFLVKSLHAHWNKYMKPIKVGSYLRVLYSLREINYSVSPISAQYGSNKIRGFTGWATFELKARRGTNVRNGVDILLQYANYVGVGKSRSIGFGEVEATPQEHPYKPKGGRGVENGKRVGI
jgi:CRISPR-associated endoribonuclease Cas6